jgi:hypothetical protein
MEATAAEICSAYCIDRRVYNNMTTAVIVTTIVTTELGETKFLDQVLEQIRKNDHSLPTRLTPIDLDAKVTTAILDIADFMGYAQAWMHRQPKAPAQEQEKSAPTLVCTDDMSEGEFMDYVLQQIHQGKQPAYAQFTNGELEGIEEEKIGEHFSQNPFLY